MVATIPSLTTLKGNFSQIFFTLSDGKLLATPISLAVKEGA
jgi:hypothetical protein